MQITIAAKQSAANEALRPWHNIAIQYPENYSLTFTQLIQWIDRTNPTWRENFGASVIDTQEFLGMQAVTNAMESLAEQSKGRVTTYPNGDMKGSEFNQALLGKVSTLNWDRIQADAVSVAKDTAEAINTSASWFLGGSMAYIAIAGIIGILVFANAAGKSVKV
ncbi:MAG: hypothetical protein AB7K68_17590 [Bacteriovoracia bacterium]